METLAGCITFGCNIPFFVFAYAKKDIKPINQAYNKVIDRDIPINVGGMLLTGIFPLTWVAFSPAGTRCRTRNTGQTTISPNR